MQGVTVNHVINLKNATVNVVNVILVAEDINLVRKVNK